MATSPDNAVRISMENASANLLDRASQVAVPTLVAHSREDAIVPFESGRQLAAVIPNARFVVLESKNHLLLMDEPAGTTFLAELRSFLGGETALG